MASASTLARLALILRALAFGALDQYLGALHPAHPWAIAISGLSAPWLGLAFLVGWTQCTARAAVLTGLIGTFAALTGYAVMTLSPLEGARLTAGSLGGFIVSNDLTIAGGILTGPLFGWLGNQWRTHRLWFGAAALAGALCLEPLARGTVGQTRIDEPSVAIGEISVGIAALGYVILRTVAQHRRDYPFRNNSIDLEASPCHRGFRQVNRT